MTTHVKGKHHIEMAAASSSSMSMAPFCRPQTSLKFIEAETLWSKFIAMHNIPFQASDHATKLFHRMFPDSEVAQKFSCGHAKTAAIDTRRTLPRKSTYRYVEIIFGLDG